MSLVPDITADQIDDWFKIGSKTVKVKTVKATTFGGHCVDPDTLKPLQPVHQHVPSYKRIPALRSGNEYAAQYQEEEQRRLLGRPALLGPSDTMSVMSYDTVSAVSTRLEELELDSTIAGTECTHPGELAPENANSVYTSYNFVHAYDDRLPITRFKEQVISTIESSQVTVIQGATGSGKTTQVPQYILDHHADLGKYCNIIVTQPRRIAAISIANRVCQERGWQIGSVCGYQVGLDRVAGDDTRILYCTTGILLNKLVNDKNMHKYTHVILDEVHERDQDTDFALLVVRKLLRTNSRLTRVVLMSATFDTSLFASYFMLPIMDRLEQAPVVDVEGKPFSVNEYYLDDLSQLGEVPHQNEGDPCVAPEALSLAVKLIERFDVMEEKEQGRSQTGFAPMRGTVLIFLPGLHEITSLDELLKPLALKHQLRLIPLHSSITNEEQGLVFTKPGEGMRKVILSTNIAESSITVPDIKYVIDFCLTKNLVCEMETNYTSLQVHWASKANCVQRKGRAGRVSNGRVYRLVSKQFYNNHLEDYGLPEMQRCPLDKLILQTKILDLGEPKAILALALAPPNLGDIERNILILKEVGALTCKGNPHDGDLTFVGRVLADLPVDIHVGKLLMLGYVFGLLEECLIIGAAMSLKNIFAQPFKQRLDAFKHKLEWADDSNSDSIAILNAYKLWEHKRERGEFRRQGGGGEMGWCKNHFLQLKNMKEVSELVKELTKRLEKFNILRPKQEPLYKAQFTEDQEKLLLKVVLAGAFYPNYFVRSEIDQMDSHRELAGYNPLNTVMVKGLPQNQGSLYRQAVEDLFRKCDPNPTAHFEETRAYIEFSRRTNSRNKVHPGVCLALKMKQLRTPLCIDLYNPDEAQARMQKLMAERQSQGGQAGKSGPLIRETGTDRVANQVGAPDPTPLEIIGVHVTHVSDCGHFWVQFGDETNFQAMNQVHSALNSGDRSRLKPLTGNPRTGQFCVAPFADDSVVEYYRAQIMGMANRFDQQLGSYRLVVEVFFVDYGNTAEVPKEELRELPSHLLKAPFQAMECELICIRPSALKCPDGKWTPAANNFFKELVLNQRLTAKPFSYVHEVLRVELIHVLPNSMQFTTSSRLIYEGFADEAEESPLSKQSNEQRKEALFLTRGFTGRPDTKRPEDYFSIGGEGGATLACQPQLLGRGGTDLSRHRSGTITLTGPDNPYMMRFYGQTNIGRSRTTKIEPTSVNSVAIEDETHVQTLRMMIAGFVGLNPSGATVIARDTTIMPLMPGLPEMVTLLFTPVAEFRLNAQKTQLIGAICGLGCDEETGMPLLPDHDIEMAFSVVVDNKDIAAINAVRMAINFAIGSQEEVASWGPDAVYKIQKRARLQIMQVLQKRREPCTIEYPQNMYCWNQLDPDDIIRQPVNLGDFKTLLNLHSGLVQLEGLDQVTEGERQRQNAVKHLQMLRDVVAKNIRGRPIKCELCDLDCPTPQLLALHLETAKHKELEQQIMGPSGAKSMR